MSGVTGSTQGFMPPRMSTGIPGLDEVLGGGLPQGNMYLVEGESGAGKTTLGLQFLLEGKRRGERTLWITLSETETQLLQSARSHNWSLDGIDVCNPSAPERIVREMGEWCSRHGVSSIGEIVGALQWAS